MKSLNTRKWLAAAAACTALVGCQQRVIDSGREAGGSDEIDTRLALDAKGRPLAGARIALVKAGDSTGRLAALSSTGAGGQYPSFNVPDGAYSATLRDAQDSLGKFLDTLLIAGGHARVGRDTLLALGKIRGMVRLVGGETPASVILSLYGTDIAANVRKDGTFEIDLVPGGLFTLMGTTTLDGYGTLLRRLQLRDGQDLVIPDTLSLPVTGLLAPREIWAESDTGTGDVRVRWSAVDHPNRMGYVLETLEDGVVTSSQFLKDTTWKDSLSAYWEGLPLLGPWPSRERVYRVRTRSLDGSGDTRSVAQTLVAKAPEWTKRMKDLSLHIKHDSSQRKTDLDWIPQRHPDLLGWKVERRVDGHRDCEQDASNGSWNDGGCPKIEGAVIEEFQDNGVTRQILDKDFSKVEYQVSSVRRIGAAESWVVARAETQIPIVTWRDSGAVLPSGFRDLEVAGRWLVLRRDGKNSMISPDGMSWEEIPDFDQGLASIAGSRDSLWLVGNPKGSPTVTISSRSSEATWSSRKVAMPDSLESSAQAFSLDGLLGLLTQTKFSRPGASWADSSRAVKHDSIFGLDLFAPGSNLGFGTRAIPGHWIQYFFSRPDGGLVLVCDPQSVDRGVYFQYVGAGAFQTQYRSGKSITNGDNQLKPVGVVDSVGWLVVQESSKTVLHLPGQDGIVVSPPKNSIKIRHLTVFHGELWSEIDGHLWKGTIRVR